MKLSIKYKILIPIILVSILLFGLTITYIEVTVFRKNVSDAKLFINSVANENANLIAKEMATEIYVTKSIATTLERINYLPKNEQDKLYKDIIKSFAKKYPELLSVSGNRQLFVTNKERKEKYGRKRFLYYRDKNKQLKEEITIREKNKETADYEKLRKDNSDAILDPYWDSFDGKDSVLMTSVSSSFQYKNEFGGLAMVDISLERLKNIVLNVDTVMGLNPFLLSNNGVYIAHNRKEIIGKPIAEIKKEADLRLKISEKVKKGESFSFIDVNPEDNTEYYVHFSPVKFGDKFRPWALAVAVPMDNIVAEARHILRVSILIGIIGLIITIIIIIIISNSLLKPIKHSVAFTKKIASGNLSYLKLDSNRTDEFSHLYSNLITMVESLRSMIANIKNVSENVDKSSKFLQNTAISFSEGVSFQATSAEEVSASMQEMVSNIEQNMTNAEETDKIAKSSSKNIKIYEREADKNEKIMQAINDKISEIDEIAFQTNILALNSAIEASKAGKYGKGFNVVAKEVRKLADKSKKIAAEISELSGNGIKISQRSSALIKSLSPGIVKTSKLISSISVSSKEQNVGAGQINNAVNNLNEVIQKNSNSVGKMSENAEVLARFSAELKQAISYFKLD